MLTVSQGYCATALSFDHDCACFEPLKRCPGTAGEEGGTLMKRASLTAQTEQREEPAPQLPPARLTDSASTFTVLALIERVALDAGADAEKLERMTAMYEVLKAKDAELAYNAAKGRILKKLA